MTLFIIKEEEKTINADFLNTLEVQFLKETNKKVIEDLKANDLPLEHVRLTFSGFGGTFSHEGLRELANYLLTLADRVENDFPKSKRN